jgi:hypothetical protein
VAVNKPDERCGQVSVRRAMSPYATAASCDIAIAADKNRRRH